MLPLLVYMMSCWCCVDSLTTWGGTERDNTTIKEIKNNDYVGSINDRWECSLSTVTIRVCAVNSEHWQWSVAVYVKVSIQGRCKLPDLRSSVRNSRRCCSFDLNSEKCYLSFHAIKPSCKLWLWTEMQVENGSKLTEVFFFLNLVVCRNLVNWCQRGFGNQTYRLGTSALAHRILHLGENIQSNKSTTTHWIHLVSFLHRWTTVLSNDVLQGWVHVLWDSGMPDFLTF